MLKNFKLFDFLLLLIGFFYGNLFAINFSNTNWNLAFIFFIVSFLELINKILYFSFEKKKIKTQHITKAKFCVTTFGFIILNTVKRGFLLGLFLEAFKVGS